MYVGGSRQLMSLHINQVHYMYSTYNVYTCIVYIHVVRIPVMTEISLNVLQNPTAHLLFLAAVKLDLNFRLTKLL